jgi:hypothetical protein
MQCEVGYAPDRQNQCGECYRIDHVLGPWLKDGSIPCLNVESEGTVLGVARKEFGGEDEVCHHCRCE